MLHGGAVAMEMPPFLHLQNNPEQGKQGCIRWCYMCWDARQKMATGNAGVVAQMAEVIYHPHSMHLVLDSNLQNQQLCNVKDLLQGGTL